MTGIIGLASNFLPPWLNPSVLALVGVGLAAGVGGAYTAHRWDAGTIANARLETANLQADYTAYKGAVAANAAKATAHALDEQIRLQDANNALQEQLQASQKEADDRSKALKALLASAKPGDLRPIGPISSAYYDRLRLEAGRSAHPGNP